MVWSLVTWLAMHDEMAEPQSADPIARESTRVIFTATKAPQPSLDPQQLIEWIPNSEYGGHAFGYVSRTRRGTFAHASADDPPAFIVCAKQDKPPVKGEPQTDPTHTAVLGLMLQDTLKPLGVKCELRYQNDGLPGEASIQESLMHALR